MAKAWRFSFLWLTVFLIASLAGTACSSTGGSSAAPTATAVKSTSSTPAAAGQNTPAAAQSGGTINIGVMGPLTGGTAIVGIDVAEGAELAAAQINEAGGVKAGGKAYKINIIRYDDQYKPEVAVNLARRLRAVDNAIVLIGPTMSSSTLAVMEINEKEGFLMITQSVHPDITAKGNKLLIRPNTTTVSNAKDVVKAVAGKEGLKNFGIIADGGDMGKSFADTLVKELPTAGGKAIATESVDQSKQTDFYPQLTNVINKKPDIIAVNVHDAAQSMIIKQARELGWTGPFVTLGLQKEGRRLAGWDKIGVGSYLVSDFSDLSGPGIKKYEADFKAKYNKDGLSYGMSALTQVYLAVRAMEKAGTVTDVEKIRAAIPDVYQEVNKTAPLIMLNYAASGQMDLSLPILKHTGDGKLIVVE